MSSKTRDDLDLRFQQYSHYTEIKQLAYNIAALQREKMFHSLAVLSFFHGEGRTLLCASLALAYAEVCRSKVLIIDTTLFASPGALAINKCLPASETRVKCISLAERMLRLETSAAPPSSPEPATATDKNDKNNENSTEAKSPQPNTDFSMIMNAAEESPEQYGLILMDTMPLSVKNRNNIDPKLVARVANASILVMSQKLLDAPRINEQLKILEDPSLHLIGAISNEEFMR